jgi:hypothetical protein
MEGWILLGLAIVGFAIGVLARSRRSKRSRTDEQTRNIYPLW